MGEVNYAPLIRSMTWSYSRLKAFDDCPYRWYLKYIRFPSARRKEMFFANYGKFVHELIASYYLHEKSADELQLEYMSRFSSQVKGSAPNRTIYKNYFSDGLNYWKSLKPLSDNVLSVESKADFSIGEARFTGFIDLLTTDESGNIILVDHKSRALKPRSSRLSPTKTDQELDSYLRQLYLYAAFVQKRYGKFPAKLCFNCFRKNLLIDEPFSQTAYDDTLAWATSKVEDISIETEFRPQLEYFKCRHLCEMQDYCEYYALSKG